MYIFDKMEPERPLYYFSEISKIPRGSGNTKAISDYIASFAKNHNLDFYQDEANNIIVKKKAYPGYEKYEGVILQGHLDMVCEKNDDVDIDFLNDNIELEIVDGFLSAKGTTLGADDGVAVAFMLSLLENDDVKAPSMECIFTVDEEIGMLGATSLDMSIINGHIMINIDNGMEGDLLAGCAGGVTAACCIPVNRLDIVSASKSLFEISIHSLTGGHSGEEIHRQRANANCLMGRFLYAISLQMNINLVDVNGGCKDNAIARSSKAVFLVDNDKEVALNELISRLKGEVMGEYAITDPEMTIAITKKNVLDEGNRLPFDDESTKNAIVALYTLPNGVVKMSGDIEGLVQTSLNMGILKCEEERVTYSFSVRSSKRSEKEDLVNKLKALMCVMGGSVSCEGEYPEWEYKRASKLQEIVNATYKEMFGSDMNVGTIHAGLECGIFAEAIRDFDCVSIGPDMTDIHTPNEKLDIKSFERCWQHLLTCLERLKIDVIK